MVICFDQLDNMAEDPQLINAFGKMIDPLVNRLGDNLNKGYSPRYVIEMANRAITQTDIQSGLLPDADVLKIFAGEYRQECDKVAADFDAWPKDTERLQIALRAYLESRPELKNVQSGADKYATLFSKRSFAGKETPCAYFINTAENNMTVNAVFNRGVKFLGKR